MTRFMRMIPVSPVVVAAMALATTAPASWAEGGEEPFEVAEIFFELNDTDGDLGIHGKVDGGPWKWMRIEDPRGRTIMGVGTRGSVRRQALTEIFFESAEPTFDELSPEEFFERFREGTYEVEGRSQERGELESETEVTHTMPAPADPTVNGEAMAVQCDDEEPGYDAPIVSAPVTIAWPAVETSHPDLGTLPPVEVEIVNYEVVVELELELDGEEFTSVMSVILPPGQMSMTVPAEFIAQSDSFKYEVLAREESSNQTAVESCFLVQ